MTNLLGTINAGYQIIKQGKRAVIGKNDNAPDTFVTWSYKTDRTSTTDYFWGHYGNQKSAEKAFKKKENEAYSD
jgi:hypothetical protein